MESPAASAARPLALAQERGDRFQEGFHLTNLGRVTLRMGQYLRALGDLAARESLEAACQAMRERQERLTSETERAAYLERVLVNREILALHAQPSA